MLAAIAKYPVLPTTEHTLLAYVMLAAIAKSISKNSCNINPRLSFILSEDNPILCRNDAMDHTHKFYELKDVHSGNRHDVRTWNKGDLQLMIHPQMWCDEKCSVGKGENETLWEKFIWVVKWWEVKGWGESVIKLCGGKKYYKLYTVLSYLGLFTFWTCCILRCLVCIVVSCLVCIVVILCVFAVLCVYCCFLL